MMNIKKLKILNNFYLVCPKCNTNDKPQITTGIKESLLTWSYCCKNCGFNYTGVFSFLDSLISGFLILLPFLLFLTQGLEFGEKLNQQSFIVFFSTSIVASLILGFILSNLYFKRKLQIYLNRSLKH